jgi:hypothetical protein
MDRLERKTNLFYNEYVPEVRAQIDELREAGHDVSELERILASLEEAVQKKDYLNADFLIEMLIETLSAARENAGFGRTDFFL